MRTAAIDEQEMLSLYLKHQKSPVLDDIMPDDSEPISFDTVHNGKVIYVQGGRFSIDQSEQNAFNC